MVAGDLMTEAAPVSAMVIARMVEEVILLLFVLCR